MAEQAELVTVTIDGTPVRVPKGTLLVEAAKQIKREIPVYCYHTKMGPAGLCRICLVDIEGMPKLQIACNTPVTDGMIVHTQNEKAADGRRAVLEVYLKNHPLDCPICDKGGECDLQDFSMAYGQDYSRSADPKLAKPKAVDLGPTIVLDEERCVVCQRCVRFDDLIVGESQLVLKDRGARDIIATAVGEPYRHNYTGNVTELCPVGALTSKQYRFKARPWDLRRTTTSCMQCSVGCRQHVDVRVGEPVRTMSVEHDDAISDTWLCDRGRYNINFYRRDDRLTQPLYKQNGRWTQIGWDDALHLWATAIREAVAANPKSVGAIGGGRLTNEEAYLLQHLMRAAGVVNLDWRAGRQRQATPGAASGTLAALEAADAIVVLGESAAERAPIADLRVRKAARHGHATVLRIGNVERAYPPAIRAIDLRGVAELATRLPKDAQRIAVMWDGVDLSLAASALSVLGGRTVTTYIASEQPNARGAEAMGMHPSFAPGYTATPAGLDASGMLAAAASGNFAVLSILGANPVLHHPAGDRVRAALEKIPFVAVCDLFMTQTAQLATLVLPAKAAFEKDGTTTNMTGDVLPINAAAGLDSPDGPLTDLELLIGLAQELRVDLPSMEDLERDVLRAATATPSFTLGDERFARTLFAADDAPLSDAAFTVAIESRIFAGGGTAAHDDRLAALRPLPQAALSPADAARLGVRTGDCVDLERGETTMHDLLVEVRDRLADGTVVLIDGLPDDPANLYAEGARVRVVNARVLEAAR